MDQQQQQDQIQQSITDNNINQNLKYQKELEQLLQQNQFANEDEKQYFQNLILLLSNLESMRDDNPLTREKSYQAFNQILKTLISNQYKKDEHILNIYVIISNLLKSQQWLDQLSAVLSIKCLIDNNQLIVNQFDEIFNQFLNLLHNQESKIRDLSSEIIVKISIKQKDQKKYCELLYNDIIKYLLNQLKIIEKQIVEEEKNQIEQQVAQKQQKQKHFPSQIFVYYTENGVYCENYIQTLKRLLEQQAIQADEQCLKVLNITIDHSNKFIREAGLSVCHIFITQLSQQQFIDSSNILSEILDKGLQDEYTHVRHESMRAVQQFFIKAEQTNLKQKYFPNLIAKICFNRHHPAEGLSAFSRDVWQLIVPVQGRETMGQYIIQAIEYYISQSYSRNHEIRQAASVSINELVSRIMPLNEETMNQTKIKAIQLTEALLNCSHFETNSIVREEALKSMSKIVQQLPKELTSLYDKIFDCSWFHIPDQSSQVKSCSAQVLALLAVSDQIQEKKILELLKVELSVLKNKDSVEGVFNEPIEIEGYIALPKQIVLNRHLADCLEGFAYLIKEIAIVKGKQLSEQIEAALKEIFYNMKIINFEKNENIKDNIWFIIKDTLLLINKKNVKNIIEFCLDPVFKDSQSTHQNLAASAKQFIKDLAKIVGPNILRGRIEMHDNAKWINNYNDLGLQ